jgi:hypothetical protein
MIFKAMFTKTEIALPISIKYSFPKKGTWAFAVQLLFWLFLIAHESKPAVEQPAQPIHYEGEGGYVRPGKAYADQRQKSRRNRRRKPSKAMANLYQLQ